MFRPKNILLSDARTRELSAAWAAGELVRVTARSPVAAARQKTPEEIKREAEEHFSELEWWLRDIEAEAVAAAVWPGCAKKFAQSLAAMTPKSLMCRDCEKHFPFPYAFSVYYLMVWTRTKTTGELAHCKTCRKQHGRKTFEEELPGQGPFRFDPVPGT